MTKTEHNLSFSVGCQCIWEIHSMWATQYCYDTETKTHMQISQ